MSGESERYLEREKRRDRERKAFLTVVLMRLVKRGLMEKGEQPDSRCMQVAEETEAKAIHELVPSAYQEDELNESVARAIAGYDRDVGDE